MDCSGTMLIQRENGKLFPYLLCREYLCVFMYCVTTCVQLDFCGSSWSVFRCPPLLFFTLPFWERVSHGTYIFLVSLDWWSGSFRDLPVFVFPVLCSEECSATLCFLRRFWRSKFKSLCLHSQLDWISHLLSIFLRGFCTAQASTTVTLQQKIAFNSRFSCLCLLSLGIIDVHHFVKLCSIPFCETMKGKEMNI